MTELKNELELGAKTLVCGPHGFLGTAFLNAIPNATPTTIDIADSHQVASALDEHLPDIVINCAGKTGRPNVDWCEQNKLQTARANITGPLVLLEHCLARNVLLVHIGSGCTFFGDNLGQGFCEQDPPNYRGSYYSRTKILADEVLAEYPVLILRLRMPFDKKSQAIVDPTHSFDRLDVEGLAALISTGRSNCVLSSRKLESAGLTLQPIHVAVDDALRSLRVKLAQSDGVCTITKEHVSK